MVGRYRQNAVQSICHVRKASHHPISQSSLLKYVDVVWIKFDGTFGIAYALAPLALSSGDGGAYFENGCVVRQTVPRDSKFSAGGLVIAIAMIMDPCCGEMRLAAIGAKPKGVAQCFLSKSEPGGSVINSDKVKPVMGTRELAISK